MKALIGNGVIGSVLQQSIDFDAVYTRKNINQITTHSYDVVYCAAPTGNRLVANNDPAEDLNNITSLIDIVKTIKTHKFILIGTVDSQIKYTAYAKNRKLLEQCILDMPNGQVVRLCSLVGSGIQKNILYDLTHNQYVSSINANDVCQWYPLSNLVKDIEHTSLKEVNFVSEPIENRYIINRCFPQSLRKVQDTKQSHYDLQPYMYTVEEIIIEMEKYRDQHSK